MSRIKKSQKSNHRQKSPRATSYDVAALAGVSQSAVSRVFQPGASASRKMRDRVMSAANELGYRPNAIARGLITNRSNLVAIVIAKQMNLSFPEVLVELTQNFSDSGVRVLLFALDFEGDAESVVEQLLQYRVDGVVSAAMLDREQVEVIRNAEIPLVFFNRTLDQSSVSSVRCDQVEGAHMLVQELVEAGHKSFGIVSGTPDSPVGNARVSSVLEKLKALGITGVPIARGDFSYQSGRTALAALIRNHGAAPDAVIAANDAMAIGCIDEARESFGLDVPKDISIAGFDGASAAAFGAYRLTTMKQPVVDMAKAAASLLLNRISDPDLPPENRMFSGEMIRGRSTRLAGQKNRAIRRQGQTIQPS